MKERSSIIMSILSIDISFIQKSGVYVMGSTANEFEVDYYENILEVIIVGMISIEELK